MESRRNILSGIGLIAYKRSVACMLNVANEEIVNYKLTSVPE